MTFTFACRGCGQANQAELAWSGRTVRCVGCGGNVVVPPPRESADDRPASDGALVSSPRLKFACPKCGRKYATAADMAGKRIRCGGCGQALAVPGAPAAASSPALKTVGAGPAAPARPPSRAEAQAQAGPAPPAFDLDDLAAVATRRSGRRGGGEAVESVLPSRSEKMAEVEQSLAEKAQAKEARKKRKTGPKKSAKRVAGGLEMQDITTMLGASVGAVALLGALGYGYPGLRFPLGGFLSGVGLIVYIAGTVGFARVARDEGYIYGVMCKFVPLYKWYYLYSRWGLMKEHFAFFTVGLILLLPGGAILRSSPFYQRIEAADREAAGGLNREDKRPPAPTPAPAPARPPAPDPAGADGEVTPRAPAVPAAAGEREPAR